MIGYAANRTAFSFKKELVIVLIVLFAVVAMPMAAVFALANSGDGSADPNGTYYTDSGSATNTYTFGFCTFWVAQRRIEVGAPIPNSWGDAHTWDDRAARDGYLVDHTPTLYAIMQTDAGDLGHVAFVESVTPDGGWTVSEMNYKGWDIISSRTFKAEQAKSYNFIH